MKGCKNQEYITTFLSPSLYFGPEHCPTPYFNPIDSSYSVLPFCIHYQNIFNGETDWSLSPSNLCISTLFSSLSGTSWKMKNKEESKTFSRISSHTHTSRYIWISILNAILIWTISKCRWAFGSSNFIPISIWMHTFVSYDPSPSQCWTITFLNEMEDIPKFSVHLK